MQAHALLRDACVIKFEEGRFSSHVTGAVRALTPLTALSQHVLKTLNAVFNVLQASSVGPTVSSRKHWE